MARRPMSAAHKAAISAGLKRYWATRRASEGPKNPGGGSTSSGEKTSFNISTGQQITREAAAMIMFGAKPRKKTAQKRVPTKTTKKRSKRR